MKKPLELKPLFVERMKELFSNDKDFQNYMKILESESPVSIRCNTLKISPNALKKRLENNSWKISQPFKQYPEIMIVENELEPGVLGRSIEHLLGYYYVQEIASMLPILALDPKPEEFILDLAAAPGSKTTQIASSMENRGTIIANEINMGRLKILASNTERCGATNVIITKKEGTALCARLKNNGFTFDKILIDAPCSGEGTLRSTPRTSIMWNINTIKKLSKIQKHLVESAFEILKVNGTLVYSTCTHAPEENEEVISYILEKFGNKVKIESIKLPIKCRSGVLNWQGSNYDKHVESTCRIYPQDSNTEGFFIAKLRRVK